VIVIVVIVGKLGYEKVEGAPWGIRNWGTCMAKWLWSLGHFKYAINEQ